MSNEKFTLIHRDSVHLTFYVTRLSLKWIYLLLTLRKSFTKIVFYIDVENEFFLILKINCCWKGNVPKKSKVFVKTDIAFLSIPRWACNARKCLQNEAILKYEWSYELNIELYISLSWTDLWEIHPSIFCEYLFSFSKIPGHELDRCQIWKSFLEIGLYHAPEFFAYHFRLNALFWTSFPEIGLFHAPKL